MDRTHPYQLSIPVGGEDHIRGADHAPITLVEFGDFECPNCLQAAPAVRMLLKKHGNRMRFVFRHFPLEEIHPHALAAAEAAEAAAGQRRFWEMHDLLFERVGHLDKASLRGYAEKLGLDLKRFDAEMADEIYRQRVREQQTDGRNSGVHATPAFFLNGRIFDVSFGLHKLSEGIDALLKQQS